jgi:hypothetical protein
MKKPQTNKPIERLFPFVLRSRILVHGRDALLRSKRRLHFILITTDISERSRDEVLADFCHYPVVQYFTPADLERHFGVKAKKVVGFTKSGLAQSIYAELKEHRLNKPKTPAPAPASATQAETEPEPTPKPAE